MTGPVVIFANLKERKLDGYPSNGMLMAASTEFKHELLRPADGAQIGERVYIEGQELPEKTSDKLTSGMYKKKIDAKVVNRLGIDDQGRLTYNKLLLQTIAGYITVPTIRNRKVA